MTTNTPAQNQQVFCHANAVGNEQLGCSYTLLTRIAELDLELARQATAVGLAVELLYRDDLLSAPIVAHPFEQNGL